MNWVYRFIKSLNEKHLPAIKRIVKSSGFWYSTFIKHYLSHLNSNLTAKFHRAGFH